MLLSVAESIPSDRSGKTHVTGSQESDVGRDQHKEVKGTSDRQERPSKEEQEEMEWMKDEILRAVVFKVRDNEEAGRESFYGLDSEEEQLFFKGLERKFEREGDLVKTWIQNRVENLDYGTGGIGVDDKPETYMPKWKSSDSVGGRNMDKFNEDRMRIMQQQMGNSSNPDTQTPSTSNTSSTSSSSSPTKSESLPRQDNLKADALTERRQSKEHASSSGNKTVVTSSGRHAFTSLHIFLMSFCIASLLVLLFLGVACVLGFEEYSPHLRKYHRFVCILSRVWGSLCTCRW